MIRCVRLWTGEDNNSHFEEGVIELKPGQRGDALSGKIDAGTISFQETGSGGTFAWHTAPVRQLVDYSERNAGFPDPRWRALPASPRQHPACGGHRRLGA